MITPNLPLEVAIHSVICTVLTRRSIAWLLFNNVEYGLRGRAVARHDRVQRIEHLLCPGVIIIALPARWRMFPHRAVERECKLSPLVSICRALKMRRGDTIEIVE